MGTRDLHPGWCRVDEEGIHVADDITAGKWEIGLTAVDGDEPKVRPWHPDFLSDETLVDLPGADAIELGRALILQEMRALNSRTRVRPEPVDVSGSHETSVHATSAASEVHSCVRA